LALTVQKQTGALKHQGAGLLLHDAV